jgi:hypothetical protein
MDEGHLDGNFWSLSQAELEIVNKYRGVNRLKCACLFKFFQQNSRFPESHSEIFQYWRKATISTAGNYERY